MFSKHIYNLYITCYLGVFKAYSNTVVSLIWVSGTVSHGLPVPFFAMVIWKVTLKTPCPDVTQWQSESRWPWLPLPVTVFGVFKFKLDSQPSGWSRTSSSPDPGRLSRTDPETIGPWVVRHETAVPGLRLAKLAGTPVSKCGAEMYRSCKLSLKWKHASKVYVLLDDACQSWFQSPLALANSTQNPSSTTI